MYTYMQACACAHMCAHVQACTCTWCTHVHVPTQESTQQSTQEFTHLSVEQTGVHRAVLSITQASRASDTIAWHWLQPAAVAQRRSGPRLRPKDPACTPGICTPGICTPVAGLHALALHALALHALALHAGAHEACAHEATSCEQHCARAARASLLALAACCLAPRSVPAAWPLQPGPCRLPPCSLAPPPAASARSIRLCSSSSR